MIMAVVMLLCLVPAQLMAEDANEAVVLDNGGADGLELGDEIVPEGVGEGAITIKRIGQWTNESKTYQEEEVKQYTSENDIIDKQVTNGGLLRGLAKQFLAWSDLPPKDNGVLSEGAKLFLPQDTVKSYQDYVRGMKAKKGSEYKGDENTIYAVYYELNGFGNSFNDWQTGSLGSVASKLQNNINNNKVMINNSVKANDVLVGTENDKVEKTDKELKIIDRYKKTDDKNTINEVVLKSEFEMEWVVAMLAYRNQYGSSQLRPILSRNDFKRYAKNQFIDKSGDVKEENIEGFSTLDGRDAGYTHVDLNMDFGKDEGLVIPEKLFLEFKSYSWRPLCAFGINDNGEKEVLNIFSVDGSPKGKNPDAFKDLVSKQDPKTKFGVETNNYRKITVRVVLRKWGNKDNNYADDRIEESDIPVGQDGTRASELLSNMTLRVLGSADGINNNENIVRITDAKAKALADGDAKEDIEVKGSIQGHVFADAGKARKGKFTVNLRSNTGIDLSEAEKVLKLSYVHKKDEPTPKPTEPSTVILTLDENYRSGEITNIEVEEGELIEPHLYIPRRRGYIFRGWSYDQKHLDEVKPGDRIYSNTTLYAIWKRAEEERVEEPEEIKGEDHKAYIFGYPNGTVRPNGSITRAEAAAMLARLLNIEAIGSAAKPQFSDTESSWYNKAINAVVFRGIMKGYPDGRFRPNAPITRAEFTQMISTIDNKPYGVAPFADVVGHWAERAIGSEYQAKRITGYPDGLFRPDANITRAEAAVILNKIFERKYDNLSLLKCKNPQMIKRFTDLDETFWGWNDMVEATNTHEFVRRYKEDVLKRLEEDWLLIKDIKDVK